MSLHEEVTHSGGCEDMESNRGLPHVLPAPRCSRNILTHPGPAAKEVAKLIVASAIACCWHGTLQAQHRSTSPFDAAMVLLKSVVEVATHSMSHLPAELDPDRLARCAQAAPGPLSIGNSGNAPRFPPQRRGS